MKQWLVKDNFAKRIGGRSFDRAKSGYKFEKIKQAKRTALKMRPDEVLLDFGIGENDEIAPLIVRDTMKIEIDRVENKGYTDNGIQEYKNVCAEWTKREFDVHVNPEDEVNHCIGSKSAFGLLAAVFINPGDYALMTVPGYPVLGTHTRYYGGNVYNIPLTIENSFLPNLNDIPDEICNKAKLLVINYPNSPTGAVATDRFFNEVIEFAKRNNIIVVHDAAHIMLTYSGKPKSFLQFDGAKDIGVEVHSMSKGFNMIGWRLGFVAGNGDIVSAFAEIKDNSDSGQFGAIQRSAMSAMQDESISKSIREKYRRRLSKLICVLNKFGFESEMPGGTYFLYVSSPKRCKDVEFQTAEGFAKYLIEKHSIVVVPWDDAGSYLRFSVTYTAENENQEDQLMTELANRLENLALEF